MADPEPVVGLPGVEYVELKNAGSGPVVLNDHIWKDRSTEAILEAGQLLPGEIIILCPVKDTLLFTNYGRVIGLDPWPRLNNSDDELELRSPGGTVLDRVSFKESWYGSSEKSEGGYSLERINDIPWCEDEMNWKASVSADGGTPGKNNSFQSNDLSTPELMNIIAEDPWSLRLDFNETLSSKSQPSIFIEPAIEISEIIYGSSGELKLILGSMLEEGLEYMLSIGNISDCSGNLVFTDQVRSFYLPGDPVPGDLLINEVLFNPFGNGHDFVEIRNSSMKYLNLRNWLIGNFEDSLTQERIVTDLDLMISPGEYLVLTKDADNIRTFYPISNDSRFLISSLPVMSNENGSLALAMPDGTLVDSMIYSSDYHYPLLREVEGVSLERLDPAAASMDRNNWKSAAESYGFATPGLPNSQSAPKIINQEPFKIEPALILPGNDGFQDYTRIIYELDIGGNVANVRVIDLRGNIIKTLAQNMYLGRSGFFTWDGTDWRSRQVKSGHYLISFEIFHADGSQKRWLGKVAVAPRF